MVLTEGQRRELGEKRFKDIRQHQKKPASEAQVRKRFKVAAQALGELEMALRSSRTDLADEIEHIAGLVQGVAKKV